MQRYTIVKRLLGVLTPGFLVAVILAAFLSTTVEVRAEELSGLQSVTLAGNPAALYLPKGIKPDQSVQVLMALHGMVGSGENEGAGLLAFAQQNNLILLAPTLNYDLDWQDPKIVAAEDTALTAKINQMVSEIKASVPYQVKNRLLLYGFSRGAQLAHRFALLYPEKTMGAVILSAGSYTLPMIRNYDSKNQPLIPFPFGVGDLEKYTGRGFDQASFSKICFWIGVGEADNDPSQTPAAWDSYIGKGRYNRARNFYLNLKRIEAKAQFTTFPATAHQETPEMREAALKFLRGQVAQVAPAEPGAVFFPETKHSLSGAFKKYWDSHGKLAQFGYPITDMLSEVNTDDGKIYTVQYFERARFELHPEFAGTDNEVLLGLLGKLFAPQVPPVATETTPQGGRYFEETGHTLSGVFLKYWQKHGGLPIYGYPVTEPFEEKNPDDGKVYLVQYFERNRFEWHPDYAGTDNEVLLGLLGSAIARQRGYL